MGSEFIHNPNRSVNKSLILKNEEMRLKNEQLRLENKLMQLTNELMCLKYISTWLRRMDRTESLLPRRTTGENLKRAWLSLSQKPEPRNAPPVDNWIKKDKDEENFDLHQINQFVDWSELLEIDFQDLEYDLFEKLKQTPPHGFLEKRLGWEARADSQGLIIQNITEKITQIEQQARASGIEKMKATDEMKPRLLEIGEEIEKLDEKRKALFIFTSWPPHLQI